MANNQTYLTVATLIAIVVIAGAVILIATQKIGSHGHINAEPGIGVYTDAACTIGLSDVDWGSLNPGARSAVTFYIKNTGAIANTYEMVANNWNPPSASQYITITWNYNGATVAPTQSIAVTMYIDIASNVVGITDFSNDINISTR